MVSKRIAKTLVFTFILVSILLSACGPSAATPTVSVNPGKTEESQPSNAAAPTEPPAAPTAANTAAPESTAAPAASDEPHGILTYSREGNTSFTRNFNPFSTSALYGTTQVIYEPLIIYNPAKDEVIPWLATKYEWGSDGKSLTFTLRENVKWSDGEPFTAKDVVATFDILKKSFANNGMDYLDSAEAVSDLNVKFNFNRAYSMAIYEVGAQVIVPAHIWKDVDDPVKFTNENPVGTGPFTEVASFESQVYELHRNNNYWQAGKPFIEGIRIPAYAGNDQANLATVNGENDWADQFIQDVDKVYVSKDTENNHYWFASTGYTVQLILNQSRAPFNDPVVRKAISMALNRQQIIKVGMYGYPQPADITGLNAGFASWKDETLLQTKEDWTKQDVDKANQMLDEAGYARGSDGIRLTKENKPMKFELLVGAASTDWTANSQIIAQNLKEIGMDVTVNAQDWGLVIEREQKGDFDMGHSWSGNGATPYFFYRSVFDCDYTKPVGEVTNENYHRGCNKDATELLKKFGTTFDLDQQKEIIKKVQNLYFQDAPAVPLFTSPEWGEYNTSRFTGFPNADNPYATLAGRAATAVIVYTTIKPK
jgi:peptide/nickel transport system substrate-binding protein